MTTVLPEAAGKTVQIYCISFSAEKGNCEAIRTVSFQIRRKRAGVAPRGCQRHLTGERRGWLIVLLFIDTLENVQIATEEDLDSGSQQELRILIYLMFEAAISDRTKTPKITLYPYSSRTASSRSGLRLISPLSAVL